MDGDDDEVDAGRPVGGRTHASRPVAEYRSVMDEIAARRGVMDEIATHRSALDAAARHHGLRDTMAQHRSALEAAGRSQNALDAAARWQPELGGNSDVQRLVREGRAAVENVLRGPAGRTTLARLAQDLGGTDTLREMVRSSIEPTMKLIAADRLDLAATAGLQRYAAVPPMTLAPAIETVTRMQVGQSSAGPGAPQTETSPADGVRDTLARAEAPRPPRQDAAGARTDPQDAVDDFVATLDAFIAVGLAGRDLTVNTTAIAWLVTVRKVDRLWGRRAARQALAVFIYVTLTVAGAAWMVNDGKPASEATFIAAALPLTVVVSVWNRLGGE